MFQINYYCFLFDISIVFISVLFLPLYVLNLLSYCHLYFGQLYSISFLKVFLRGLKFFFPVGVSKDRECCCKGQTEKSSEAKFTFFR